ncbi:nucleotide sugar dehydrogenase [Neptuniibacter caesariensis]|uniref:Probable UDP-glucose/GDP-mannose dehydrogenase n=1 Tax=Neptuniibacter caesariensis TaxID=207954 RepID=A0A7U8C2Y1_NEPCE|nr:nucleotide sugar dehydrogenase [Neptuniibacter caesariensis]EAR60528.1 probable UDP-glucose/GDP-mannose dehydrogenase [Oceanospirillum sp. MED92] [Neptuniibacter caesariensis]
MKNVGVIGLGYVGIPLSLSLIKAGYFVSGFDKNEAVVEALNNSDCLLELWQERVSREVQVDVNARFASSSEVLNGADAVVICVPTPLDAEGNPDHGYVDAAVSEILKMESLPSLVILESTVSPGYTRQGIVDRLNSEADRVIGEEIHVCFSPEREDPGNEVFSNVEIPKVIGGFTAECLAKGAELYMPVFNHVVRASSLESAELCKLHENTFRAININYVNELRDFAAAIDIDFDEVVALAKTKPFGFMPFDPGIGVGGHCIPVDPHFLLKAARDKGVELRAVEDTMQSIHASPKKIARWIEKQCEIAGDQSVLITGAAYKDGVSDIRCSPAIEVINALSDSISIHVWDPLVALVEKGGDTIHSLSDEEFRSFEGVVAIVNAQGRKFVDHNCLAAKRVIDARYKLVMNVD